MPRFVQAIELHFRDGPPVDVETNLWDQLDAERGINGDITKAQAEMGARVWYCALRRQYPEHPAARSFRDFTTMTVAVVTEDERAAHNGHEPEPDGLDPIRPAGSAG